MIDEVEDYAILLLNKDGIIQNWNRGAEKIKGYQESEIIGQHFRVFYLPEDQAKHLPEQLMARASKEGKALHEGWRVRKDKTVFWGSIVITALHDANNQIIGFSKVTRDLTERKRAEDELAFQNQELQRFAYVAAHDMKEPLRKLHYYTSYIASHGGDQLPDRDKDYLARASAAASRMQALIDDLLAYSKTTDYANTFEPVDLNKVLEEVKLLHQDTIEETGAQINNSRLPEIRAIPFQMVQLFDNLLGNALKYRHPDRAPNINITAELTNVLPGPDIAYAGRQQFHFIRFSDNGIGFQPGEGNKIFNVFERLHTRTDYAGNGIGLAICKKIVQNHKGHIYATGSAGMGAVFSVYIPTA
jgi:PAS domain S-box-containing protein